MNNILKITKLYLKRYTPFIILILFIYSVIGFSYGNIIKNQIKQGTISYKFNKNNNYNYYDMYHSLDRNTEQFRDKYKKDFDNYYNNFNEKLTFEDIDILKQNIAFDAYANYSYNYDYYNNHNIYVNNYSNKTADYYLKFFNKEQYENRDKLKVFEKMKNQIYSFEADSEESKKFKEDINKLVDEIEKIYPLYVVKYDTDSHIFSLMYYNLENDSDNLSVKEIFYEIPIIIGLSIMSMLIIIVIFALEYHTNFGKFIATLPYKKTTIYFSKLLTSIIILLIGDFILSLSSLWTIKTSVLSNVVSISSAFFAYNKILLLTFFVLLLGAIFASFCGSVVSIICMYLPTMFGLGYFIILLAINFNTLNIVDKSNFFKKFNNILAGDNPLYVPARLFIDGFYDVKYYYLYFTILLIVTILSAKIYKHHNVEDEGKFFTIKLIKNILYVISVISFASVFAILINTTGLNIMLSYMISYLILIPLIYLLFNLKLKI